MIMRGFAVTLLIAMNGCGGEGGSGRDVVRRDSAGVTIVESPPAFAQQALSWIVDTISELDIGAVQADEPYQLFRVTGAAQLGDGRIAIVNAGTQEVRFFDNDGVFLHSVGGRGEGPGEYQFPALIPAVVRDTLWIEDRMAGRLSLLGADGQLLTTIVPRARIAEVVGVFAGRLLTSQGSARAAQNSPEGMMPNDITYALVDLASAAHDTVAGIPGFALFLSNDGGRIAFTTVPFDIGPSAAAGTDRFYVVPGESPDVMARDSAGVLREIFRTGLPLESVPRSAFDAAIAEHVSRASDDAAAAELRRRYSRMPIPTTMPIFQNLLLDAGGHIWLETFRADRYNRPEWVVLDPAGSVLGRIALPANVAIEQIGLDFVLGVMRDASDVEHVVRYRLHRS
jgi:hypothetical protein